MKAKRPGESLTSTYTAAWYNWVNRTLTQLARGDKELSFSPEKDGRLLAFPDDDILEFDRFSPVNIAGSAVKESGTTTHHNYSHLLINDLLDASWPWGIIQSPIANKRPAEIVIQGLTWATFEMRDTDHPTVDIVDGALKSTYGGRGHIVDFGLAVGNHTGLINLVPPYNLIIEGPVQGGFTGTPNTFTVTPIQKFGHRPFLNDIEVENVFYWESATEGARCTAIFDLAEQKWHALQLECT